MEAKMVMVVVIVVVVVVVVVVIAVLLLIGAKFATFRDLSQRFGGREGGRRPVKTMLPWLKSPPILQPQSLSALASLEGACIAADAGVRASEKLCCKALPAASTTLSSAPSSSQG
jgi:hypothetical protein